MEIMNLFKTMILMQLFYSFAITTLSYAMPDDTMNFVTSFSDITEKTSLDKVSSDVQQSLSKQTNIPVVELGALVFYSGNILIDLILNFLFAIPEMIAMLINGLLMIFSIDSNLFAFVEIFTGVAIGVFYMIGIIQLLLGLRSGRTVI